MQTLSHILKRVQRHYTQIVAFAVGVVVVIVVMVNLLPDTATENQPVEAVATTTMQSESVLERSSPTMLRIPKINVEAEFGNPLGLKADQTIEVPDSYEEVGWYKYGPTPGEVGPAVVLGHVDSYQGAAVFYHLGQLEAGDLIYIDRADGTTVTFEVTKLERHKQSDFPTAEVYGDLDYAGLRLITCTGTYDRSVLRYTHNLIVFARLVEG